MCRVMYLSTVLSQKADAHSEFTSWLFFLVCFEGQTSSLSTKEYDDDDDDDNNDDANNNLTRVL